MTPSSRAAHSPLARTGALAATSLGLLTLAGCAPTGGSTTPLTTDGATGADSAYADGTYSAEGGYVSPGGQQKVAVELTLENDIVTAVTVTPEGQDPQSLQFQEKFAGGIADAIVGQDIDTLNVSRVAGSSLTSGGFNDALATIKAEALAP
ncbi:hypothetical protein [Salinibacterium sp. ZJ70]|uniref:FMN-binding protein n=1 Tax=Salinibacterium sp. ZJ70 TaxID=2708084 RepID=UPI00141EE0B5|nr:hypothetical protein [Salinibacterium sp. ZJ70]